MTGKRNAATNAVTGASPTKCNVGGLFSTYRKKILEIKEDICYVVVSVAGRRGRLLFRWTQSSPRFARRAHLREVAPREIERDMSKKLFVGSLSWDTNDEGLRNAFSAHGEISEAIVISDRDTGRSRGFGFVTFDDDEAADKAVAALNGTDLDGRTIKVDVAQAKQRSGGGGGGGGGGRGGYSGGW
jgi:cold-inducible RNA-binding protein